MRATRLIAAVFLGLAAGACATVTPEEQRRGGGATRHFLWVPGGDGGALSMSA
jgi:hypothetical protein